MKRTVFSNSIAFLLFILMVFKVSSFHVYSHQDTTAEDIENCAVCALAIENHNAEFVFCTPQTIKVPFLSSNTTKQTTICKVVVSSSLVRFSLFGRPPPNLV